MMIATTNEVHYKTSIDFQLITAKIRQLWLSTTYKNKIKTKNVSLLHNEGTNKYLFHVTKLKLKF